MRIPTHITIAAFLLLLAKPLVGHAAFLRIADTSALPIGGQTAVAVTIDTQGEAFNAVEGSIAVPTELGVSNVTTAHSIVSVWINPPHLSNGHIEFTGLVPGGYTGQSGEIFSIEVSPVKAGTFELKSENLSILKNDGKGTPLPVLARSLSINVKAGASVRPAPPKDTIAPEPFTIELAHDPSIFEDRWFISYATIDKQSGLDRYEVDERTFLETILPFLAKKPVVAPAPYPLGHSSLTGIIRVNAIDREGNTRTSSLVLPGFKYALIFLIAVLVVLAFVLVRRKRK